MRKILRNKARAAMRRAGYTKINKPRRAPNGAELPSFFALNWRRFC